MLTEDSSADYTKVVKESEDTLGCFLFGCEDPLKLPDFQSDFHIKKYKRIKVYASKRHGLSTQIEIKDKIKLTLFLVGSGETKGCDRPKCKIEPITKNRLVIKVGDTNLYPYPNYSYRDNVSQIK